MTDCYHQVDEGEEGTFTKVGVVKRKIFVTQKLREEDRKRVKTATETHEKERLSHKYVAPQTIGISQHSSSLACRHNASLCTKGECEMRSRCGRF